MALADNLVAYWSLEDLTDSKGSSTLTNNAAATFVAGRVANAGNFVAASSQSLSCVSSASLQAGDIDMTLCFWANLTTITTATGVVGKGAANAEYRVKHNASGAFAFDVRDTANAVTTTATWGSNAVAATWYFVACRHDATNNLISISVNAGTPVTAATSGGVRSSTGTWCIGALNAASNYHNGLIDECGFWKRYLSDAEISDLYNGGAGRNYAYISTAGASITATAAITLGTMTAAATGTLAIAGSAAPTLGAATLAATGQLALSGQLAATLGGLTLAATGALGAAPITATAAIILGGLTLSSTGTLVGAGISGAASIQLGPVTLSSLGLVVIIGAATIQLGSLTLLASERAPVIELAYGFVYGAAASGGVYAPSPRASVYGATNTGEVS